MDIRKNRGITLIALIITVIVMLIIAGATLSAIKINGIPFGKVTEGAEKHKQGTQDEANMFEELLYLGLTEEEFLHQKYGDAFVTEWTVDAGDSITLPIVENYVYHFEVDYGDGTVLQITSATDANKVHTYDKAGTYMVKILGTCEAFNFQTVNISKDKISKLISWGNIGIKSINFYQCSNLTGGIPTPFKGSFVNVTSFDSTFRNCTKLTGAIPKDLFANCPNVESFAYTFNRCSGLTGDIPENLFASTPNVVSFQYTFDSCTGLTGSIPNGLFANCTKARNFLGTFAYSGLTGNIPDDLFLNCTSVVNFSATFHKCNGLTGNIPENLFASSPNVVSFQYTFYECSGLTGNIPESLFANSPKVNTFEYIFYGCNSLTGKAIDLWTQYPSATGTACYGNCLQLTNYTDIPDAWK